MAPTVDLGDPAAWQDLASVLAPAREAHPVGISETGIPMVLRFDAVEAMLRDHDRFGQNDLSFLGHPPGSFVNEWYGQSLAAIDPPDHTRLRALVSRAFTYRRIEELRGKIVEIARASMLPSIESGEFEALGRFASMLPVKAVMALLDIPDDELERFFDLAHDFGLLFSFKAANDPAIMATLRRAMDGLDRYVMDLVERRRREPGDDLVSELISVTGGERMTEQELVIMVGTFLYAGVETTEAMLPIIIYLLARHPDQFALLRRQPELVPNAVEEALRFEPNVAVIARVAKEKVELAGVSVEPGDLVLGSVVAANRDPRRWDDPDRFDVTRDKPKTIGFGGGVHHCIGATLARLELQEATKLLLRARTLELVNDPQWEPFSNTRQFDRVAVRAAR